MPEDTLYEWPARKFWFKHLYLAWEAHTNAEYNRLIMKRQ